MSGIGKLSSTVWLWLGVALLLSAAAVPLGRSMRQGKSTSKSPNLQDWEVSQLVDYFESQGLPLRPVASNYQGGVGQNLFLTRTDQGLAQLNILPKTAERIEKWRGSVYCERLSNPDSRSLQIQDWGNCCIVVQ